MLNISFDYFIFCANRIRDQRHSTRQEKAQWLRFSGL